MQNQLFDSFFFEKYFEKKFFLEQENEFVKSFKYDLEEFEKLLWYTKKIDESKIQISLNSKKLDSTDTSSDDILTVCTQALAKGYSIAINYAENFDEKLAFLVREVGEYFDCLAYSTVVLTPPNSNLFKKHYDGIDVIVMQLEGEKIWEIGGFGKDLASKNFTIIDEGLKTTHSHLFTKYSLGYIPRGMVHKVSTSEDFSLHISIGLHHNRKIDVFHESLNDLEDEYISLRRALNKSEDLNDEKILKKVLVPINSEKAIERLNSRKYSQLDVLPDDKLRKALELKKVDKESIIEKQKGMPISYTIIKDCIRLSFPMSLKNDEEWIYKSISLPIILLPTARFLKDINSPFTINELPGLMDFESKIILIQELINCNLLKCK